MSGKFKIPFLSTIPVFAFMGIGALLAAQSQGQDEGTTIYPVSANEIDASVTGDDRTLLENAMSQFPPEQRGKVIVVTSDGYVVSNHPELLQDVSVTSDPATAPPPIGGTTTGDTVSTTGSDGMVGPPGSTTGATTGETTGTTTGSTTGSTTGTTTGTTTGSTTGSTTGTTTGTTSGTTTGTTSGTTTGSTTGGTRDDAIGCDCSSGTEASQTGRTFKNSGPYRRRITTHGQGVMGVAADIYLPGRTYKADATPLPTFTQLKQNNVFHRNFMRSTVPGFEFSEQGNPWIYMGGSTYDIQGNRYNECDLGLQASGVADKYALATSYGGYRYLFDYEKVNFEMDQTIRMVCTPGNACLGLLVEGNEYVPGDTVGDHTSVLIIAWDTMYETHPFWSQTRDNGEFKMCTSIAQAALYDDYAHGNGWIFKNQDVNDMLSWICGVHWSNIEVKPLNGYWRSIVAGDIADTDNYPAAVVNPETGAKTNATGWLNKPIVVTVSSVSDETVSIDLRRGRTQ